VLYNVVYSFALYFKTCKFLFICRNICNTHYFIQKECKKLGLYSYKIVELESPTLGQAHTTTLGLQKADISPQENILIFNIDTFRPHFKLPNTLDFANIDGYLEVFESGGEEWSFVLPQNPLENKVIKTTEKQRISSLCSSGLYYFAKAGDFIRIFQIMINNNQTTKGEYYIAPMYNYLIKEGKDIRYFQISPQEIIFCGTPKEYESLKAKYENSLF
ncbi:MAG: capsular biosynthesis protein, partial [Helicobacter sp.]|nr:capsular biosynthesis protein [Helicobacter sp.]